MIKLIDEGAVYTKTIDDTSFAYKRLGWNEASLVQKAFEQLPEDEALRDRKAITMACLVGWENMADGQPFSQESVRRLPLNVTLQLAAAIEGSEADQEKKDATSSS